MAIWVEYMTNTEIAYWNGPAGEKWVKRQATWDRVLYPVATALLDLAAPRSGERVVDVGCGCGATSFMLAERVGVSGHVLGLDVSAPMLVHARHRQPAGLPLDFVLADATDYGFAESADLMVSRFGVMFFSDPVRAFANLRSGLRSGGRLAFSCFRKPSENLWAVVPLQAAYLHVPPLPKLGPEDPGPFSFADPERVQRILSRASFSNVRLTPLDVSFDLAAGEGLDAAVASVLEIGSTSRAIEGAPASTVEAVASSVREALSAYQEGSKVPLPAAIWLVTAENV